eukprot:COSAG04_NODE_27_length_37012_cov_29.502127_17_plen_87_part_00
MLEHLKSAAEQARAAAMQYAQVRIEGYGADTAMRLPPGGARAQTMFVVAGRHGDGQRTEQGAIPGLGGGIMEIARGREHTLVLKGE